MGRLTLNKVI